MRTINTLSAADARTIMDAAIAKANEIQLPMCISVVDAACNLLCFERMDGGKTHSINVSMDKAYTAASVRKATSEIYPNVQPGQPLFGIHTQQGGRFCIVAGGIPVMVGGECVGAVGVSSGTIEQDMVVAEAGIEAFLQLTAATR